MSIHDGHRARLRQRYLQHGAEAFDDRGLLELLLCYALPRGDVNPLVDRLLEHFGSLAGVLDASAQELQRVDGIGENTALLLNLLPQLLRRYQLCKTDPEEYICSSADAADYLLPYFFGERNELLFMLSLDAGGRVLGIDRIGEGSFDEVELNVDAVIAAAERHRASSVILAHNHVSGILTPSQADLQATQDLRQQLQPHRIALLDHLVIADGTYRSMAECKEI